MVNAESHRKSAIAVIITFGIISLFSDMCYQSGRSLQGPFLGQLGADAFWVALTAGLAEFFGYAFRLVMGPWVDRTRAYWLFTALGYLLLASVPLMALAGTWQVAALFVVFERLSKAVRAPAKDTILSMAAKAVGTGYGFGLHKIMDQVGAITGPLLMALILSGILGNHFQGPDSYRLAFLLLAIPFGLMLLFVLIGRNRFPHPEKLEQEFMAASTAKPSPSGDKLGSVFWVYCLFTLLNSVGFVSFALLSFHAVKTGLLADSSVPLWYALAMALDGVAGVLAGRFYDRRGFRVLLFIPLFSLPLPFLGFMAGSVPALVAAILLWGVALGLQETIIKAGIADLTQLKKRGTGYGIFNTVNGIGGLLAGLAVGALYQISGLAVGLFVAAFQVAAFLVLVFLMAKAEKR